jgi:hypothetical protein
MLIIALVFILEMDDLQTYSTFAEVADFLSTSDLVMLGCTCKELERKVRDSLGRILQRGKEGIESDIAAYRALTPLMHDGFETREAYQDCRDGENERYECFIELAITRLAFRVRSASITKSGTELKGVYLPIGGSGQGGLVYVSCLHLAAAIGDLQLCRILVARGASINANIFIPNDQDSRDKSARASNRDDGMDFSQYRWGLITPLRLARTFSYEDVCNFLLHGGGILATDVVAGVTIRNTFESISLPSLGSNSCWISQDGKQLMFKNTYMNGDRRYQEVLFNEDLESSIWELLRQCDEEDYFDENGSSIMIDPDEIGDQSGYRSW